MLCRIPGSLLPPPPMTSSVRSEDEIDLVIEAAGKNRVILGSVESFNPVPDRSCPPSTLVLSNVRGSPCPPIFRILTLIIAENSNLLIFDEKKNDHVRCHDNSSFRTGIFGDSFKKRSIIVIKARDKLYPEKYQNPAYSR